MKNKKCIFEDNLTIALAGNPNSRKASIRNQMTETRQRVGNWPGVAVEKRKDF